MLEEAARRHSARSVRRPNHRISLQFIEANANALPFGSEVFDAVTFTFLLRYVVDPIQPLREMARVLRPGGHLAMLEFAIPVAPFIHNLWLLYVFACLPLLARSISPGWARVGDFLGKSISDFYKNYPMPKMIRDWESAGFANIRFRYLSLGGAVVVAGVRQ
jgi:demethylmenaquinone methyltransferase/2-methoxy-6-polyprenyl-1,4-benzoquinol methylase